MSCKLPSQVSICIWYWKRDLFAIEELVEFTYYIFNDVIVLYMGE